MPLEELAKALEPLAKRRGYRFERASNAIRIWHESAPFYVEVMETSKGVRIRLGYEGLRDYIREIVDTEADPRDYIEDILDSLSSLAHEVYEEVKRRGYTAVLEAREAVMDILEELEEAMEE